MSSLAFGLHDIGGVTAATITVERRQPDRHDRRRNSRSGRRATDPRTNWRRLAWLFAAYAVYVSIRSLPGSVKTLTNRLRRRNQVGA